MKKVQTGLLLMGILILCLQFVVILTPAEGQKRYQYKVVAIAGSTELRTQSDVDKGRVGAIEKVIQDHAAQGWEFLQADGYILYFRR